MVVRMLCIVVFFFKQKTAYEMRISDWSSDVCSSDLRDCRVDMAARRLLVRVTAVDGDVIAIEAGLAEGLYAFGRLRWLEGRNAGLKIGRASCRDSVCQYV